MSSSDSSLPQLSPRSAAAAAAARGMSSLTPGAANSANKTGGGNSPGSTVNSGGGNNTVFALSPLQRLESTAHYRHGHGGSVASGTSSGGSGGNSPQIHSVAPAKLSPRGVGPAYSNHHQQQQHLGNSSSSALSSSGSGSNHTLSPSHRLPDPSTLTPPKGHSVSPGRDLPPLPGSSNVSPGAGGGRSVSGGSSGGGGAVLKQNALQQAALDKLDALPRKGTFVISTKASTPPTQ